MSRKHRQEKRLPPFVPLFVETLGSAAWKQTSFGARALFIALRKRCFKNNGHVYLSLRDASEELGHKDRNHIANWYRELEHYGFLVKTEGASLGVDGKGKAPHWRFTDLPVRAGNGELKDATRDFLRWNGTVFEPHVRPSWKWNARKAAALKKQNPGRDVAAKVGVTFIPEVGVTFIPPDDQSATSRPYRTTEMVATSRP
jgi:hypothetical protein